MLDRSALQIIDIRVLEDEEDDTLANYLEHDIKESEKR